MSVISDEASADAGVLFENEAMRSETAKHFRLSDGTGVNGLMPTYTFGYDDEGRGVKKTVGNETVEYFYEGDRLVTHIMLERVPCSYIILAEKNNKSQPNAETSL